MKYKWIALAAVVCLLIFSLTNLSAVFSDENPRYHQHLESPAYLPCSDHGEELLCSHLPLIIIETGGEEIPGLPVGMEDKNDDSVEYTTTAQGEKELQAFISVIDNSQGNNHLTDEPALESLIKIRVRGHSSRYYEKSSYLIKTLNSDGTASEDVAMLGMDKFDEWALYGPYLDKSLIRNYMWYNICGEIMDYAPNVRFCEVILNGEYQGLYVMTETIDSAQDARMMLTEPSREADPCSYVLRLDRGSSVENRNITTFTQYALRNLQEVNIVYPGSSWLTPERIEWIVNDFSDFEKSLYSYDYKVSPYAWWDRMDSLSFADYFIINEISCNYDSGWLSTYIYRDVRGKFKMCVWDFNSACENYYYPVTDPHHFELQHNIWYFMISKDDRFTEELISRYRQLRQSFLSDEYLCSYIDDTVEWLGPAIDRNFSRWDDVLAKNMVSSAERNPHTHEEAVSQLKDFCLDRGAWMDEHIEILRQYSHDSKNKKFNH